MIAFNKILLVLFGLYLFVSCNNSPKTDNHLQNNASVSTENEVIVTKEQFSSAGMSLAGIDSAAFYDVVSTKGYLDVPPQNKASVSVFLGGYVKDIYLLPGEKVKKGQVLLTLTNIKYIELQQSYLEIKEQLNYLKAEYKRQENLASENIASKKYFEKVKSDYNQSIAKYNGLKEKLKLLNIDINKLDNNQLTSEIKLYSPISGSIVTLNGSPGVYMSPSDVILSIVNSDHLHLELSVFEKDILKIKKDQEIQFRIPNTGEQVYTGKVFLIGKSVNSKNRSILVHGHLDKENPEFIPGMYIEAAILTNKSMASSLPLNAIVKSGNNSFILVQINETKEQIVFEKRKIKTGRLYEKNIEILNPDIIDKNEEILVSGAFFLM